MFAQSHGEALGGSGLCTYLKPALVTSNTSFPHFSTVVPCKSNFHTDFGRDQNTPNHWSGRAVKMPLRLSRGENKFFGQVAVMWTGGTEKIVCVADGLDMAGESQNLMLRALGSITFYQIPCFPPSHVYVSRDVTSPTQGEIQLSTMDAWMCSQMKIWYVERLSWPRAGASQARSDPMCPAETWRQ